MYVAVGKFMVQPEWADQWMELVSELTEKTKAEAGCRWFEWTRSMDEPNDFLLVEGFDDGTHRLHAESEYVGRLLPGLLEKLREPVPRFIVAQLPNADGWLTAGAPLPEL
jgi:quinol monooxygenase YgiN